MRNHDFWRTSFALGFLTLALLQLNAVVGLTGVFDAAGSFRSMGIQCALCHSTVDNSFAPGIGHRLDGWPNRDLDVGTIVSLAPDLSVVAALLATWVTTHRHEIEPKAIEPVEGEPVA